MKKYCFAFAGEDGIFRGDLEWLRATIKANAQVTGVIVSVGPGFPAGPQVMHCFLVRPLFGAMSREFVSSDVSVLLEAHDWPLKTSMGHSKAGEGVRHL